MLVLDPADPKSTEPRTGPEQAQRAAAGADLITTWPVAAVRAASLSPTLMGLQNPTLNPSVPAQPGPAWLAPPLGCGNPVLMVPLVKLVKLLWSPGAGAQQDSLFHLLWRGQSSWWRPPPPSGLHQDFWTRPPPAPLGFTTPPPGLQHRLRPWLRVLRLRTRSAQVHIQVQDPGLDLAPTPTPRRCLQGDVSGLLPLLLECALVLIG